MLVRYERWLNFSFKRRKFKGNYDLFQISPQKNHSIFFFNTDSIEMFFLGFWLISAPFHFPEVDSLHIILTGIFGKLKQIVLSFEFSSLDRTMLSENKCIFNGLFRQREKIQRWCWHFFVWIFSNYFGYFWFYVTIYLLLQLLN